MKIDALISWKMNEIVRVFFKWKIYYSANDFVNFKKLPENFGPKIGLARNHVEILPTPIGSLKVVKITINANNDGWLR